MAYNGIMGNNRPAPFTSGTANNLPQQHPYSLGMSSPSMGMGRQQLGGQGYMRPPMGAQYGQQPMGGGYGGAMDGGNALQMQAMQREMAMRQAGGPPMQQPMQSQGGGLRSQSGGVLTSLQQGGMPSPMPQPRQMQPIQQMQQAPQGLLGSQQRDRNRFVQQSYHKPWDQLTGQQQRWINLKYPGQG